MARNEADREDLLRDATALVERVALQMADEPAEVFAGFRHDGCVSIYIGPDPVYHFNSAGELRRAFADGALYKAEQGRLVQLVRCRSEAGVELQSHQLTPDETTRFSSAMGVQLNRLAAAIRSGEVRQAGQVPEHADVVGRLFRWLTSRKLHQIPIARRPHAR